MDIFHRTKKRLYNFVLKMTYDRLMTEDIVQDVFLKFFESMDKLNTPSRAEFWLFTTARNEIYQYYRKKKIHIDKFNPEDIEMVEPSSDESPAAQLELRDIRNHLQEELMFIPPEQKEVFLLKEYGGLSYKEISEVMNIDIDLVKSRLHKVRRKMINRISKIIN